MLEFFRSGGIGTAHVRRITGAGVGSYMITLDGAERNFTYWRSTSAARLLAEKGDALASALQGARMAYLSGITLAILSEADRNRLLAALAVARAAGTTPAFDPNMRPRLWPDLASMRATILRAAAQMDIVLPSFDEEAAQLGDPDPTTTARRHAQAGAGMVAVKNGSGEMVVRQGGVESHFQPIAKIRQRYPRQSSLTRAARKQAMLIAMLQRPEGATMQEIITATGWQAHCARGVMSGTSGKKTGVDRRFRQGRCVGKGVTDRPTGLVFGQHGVARHHTTRGHALYPRNERPIEADIFGFRILPTRLSMAWKPLSGQGIWMFDV